MHNTFKILYKYIFMSYGFTIVKAMHHLVSFVLLSAFYEVSFNQHINGEYVFCLVKGKERQG